jgi:trans-aconitate methyltransferase
MAETRIEHWDAVYASKADENLSWHQDDPAVSLELCDVAGISSGSSVIDVGGGTSRFASCLLSRGVNDLALLDVSRRALEKASRRLGDAGRSVDWIVGDVTTWSPQRQYDLWHDRAVFHFLVAPGDRAAYVERLVSALRRGGHAIVATFAPEGPETCSALPVMRYDADLLGRTLGEAFRLATERRHEHLTPWGTPQAFQYCLFRKAG